MTWKSASNSLLEFLFLFFSWWLVSIPFICRRHLLIYLQILMNWDWKGFLLHEHLILILLLLLPLIFCSLLSLIPFLFLKQQAQVRLVSSSELLELLDPLPTNSTSFAAENTKDGISNSTSSSLSPLESLPSRNSSQCSLVLFYYPWCTFSAKAAPHFNAIGRLFPGIHVLALDAYSNNGYTN